MEQITSVLLGRRQRSDSFEQQDDIENDDDHEVPGLMSDADSSSDDDEEGIAENDIVPDGEGSTPHFTGDDSSRP